MNILLTNPSSRLSRELAQHLGSSHEVELSAGPFGHEEPTDALVRGKNVIIHSLKEDNSVGEVERLDEAMRQTYNLLWAAVEHKVEKFLFLGSLSTMSSYDPDFLVNEKWKPVPTTDINTLSCHMSEFVCREFGREKNIDVRCLRMGELYWDESISCPSGLLGDDAIQAVEKVLTKDMCSSWPGSFLIPPTTWHVFHIQSSTPEPRFSTQKAQDLLSFSPTEVK